MKKHHLLMLGAGFMQKPAIESAKNLGWRVTVVDGNPKAVCASLADAFEPIDLKDTKALIEFAKKLKETENLDCVFTAGTDFSASVAAIAEACGFKSHSLEAALNATDKSRMRSCFASYGAPSPKFIEADSVMAQRISDCALKSGKWPFDEKTFPEKYPLVVKPVDNMGARGCITVFSLRELAEAVQTAVPLSRTGRAIIEEYMDGPEFSIDSLVFEDKLIITGFADRHIYYPPYFIEMGHTMPTEFSEEDRNAVIKAFAKGVKALGLSCGAAKGDMKLTSNGAMIGEIAARLSGGYMSGWTFPYASGLNLTEQALFLASGEKSPIFDDGNLKKLPKIANGVWYLPPEKWSAERAWISIPGKVQSVSGLKEAEKIKFLKDIFPRSGEGDTVVFPENNVEKCGNCISKADTRIKAVNAAEDAAASIEIRLEPDNAETKDFLESRKTFPPSAFQVSADVAADIDAIADERIFDSSIGWECQIPHSLRAYLEAKDWNHRTMKSVLDRFIELEPSAKLKMRTFWRYLIRGSLQGVLFAVDSCKKN
ncbi:MAG: ATP-grasp domain-containing protein [Spirochaetaceae bacterium]|nr:ATP-grasp domain-containing protein [Spirochaetaceae bacterium]